VVQWIRQQFPELLIRVRFLSGAPSFFLGINWGSKYRRDPKSDLENFDFCYFSAGNLAFVANTEEIQNLIWKTLISATFLLGI
jgi:hypothetical protein